jgi:hypothetical protein
VVVVKTDFNRQLKSVLSPRNPKFKIYEQF